MMTVNLKTDTVVLSVLMRRVLRSACETARGRVGNGEGLIGMTWGAVRRRRAIGGRQLVEG
jgi:hypothetical protein